MYYSHSAIDDQFNFFISFLTHAINGEKKYEAIVSPIIQDAHGLAIGEKNVYNIDRNNYQIIIYLIDNDFDFLKSVNIKDITKEDYKHVLDILTKPREISIA